MEKYSRIDIVDAHLEDEGNYECLANNFAGQGFILKYNILSTK